MSIINSTHIRSYLRLHVSGNEMKEIERKYQNGYVKHLSRDIKRIANTIHESNKTKCDSMVIFLVRLHLSGSKYYTPSVEKAISEYSFKIYSNKAGVALKTYSKTFGNYKKLNSALRNDLPLNKKLQETNEGLREVFDYNANTGYTLKTFRAAKKKTQLSSIKEGETGLIKGYLSTSRDINVAKGFGREKKGEFNILFGKSHVDISKYANDPEEQEELYPHGVIFKKLFQHDLGDKRINVLEEVSAEPTSERKASAALDLATEKETPKVNNFARKSNRW